MQNLIQGVRIPFYQKNAKHNNISDVCAYRTNRVQFCLKERIGSKMFGTKVSQKSINFGDIKKKKDNLWNISKANNTIDILKCTRRICKAKICSKFDRSHFLSYERNISDSKLTRSVKTPTETTGLRFLWSSFLNHEAHGRKIKYLNESDESSLITRKFVHYKFSRVTRGRAISIF